jgi:hypothetical protein
MIEMLEHGKLFTIAKHYTFIGWIIKYRGVHISTIRLHSIHGNVSFSPENVELFLEWYFAEHPGARKAIRCPRCNRSYRGHPSTEMFTILTGVLFPCCKCLSRKYIEKQLMKLLNGSYKPVEVIMKYLTIVRADLYSILGKLVREGKLETHKFSDGKPGRPKTLYTVSEKCRPKS